MRDLSEYNTREIRREVCQRIKLVSIPTYALEDELRRRGVDEKETLLRTKGHGFVQFCADHFDLTVSQLTGPGRTQRVAESRLVSMAVASKVLKMKGLAVALLFGRKDHSSAVYARATVAYRPLLRLEAVDLEHKWKNQNQKKT